MSLTCERADYDGMMQMMHARKNVEGVTADRSGVTHSLDFDRLYNMANFFDGGTLIDGKDKSGFRLGRVSYPDSRGKVCLQCKVAQWQGCELPPIPCIMTYQPLPPTWWDHQDCFRCASVVQYPQMAIMIPETDKAKLFGRSTLVDKVRRSPATVSTM